MTTSPRPNWSLALGLPLLVILVCIFIVYSPFFTGHSARLSTAVTLDLTVTAPLLYFLAIRRTAVARITVIRVFLMGVLVAGWLLSGRGILLQGIKTWVSPVVEAMAVGAVIWNIRKARRQSGDGERDMLTHLRSMAAKVLGNERAGDVLGSELAVIYYAVAGRSARTEQGQGAVEFSYARAGGALPVLGAFMICMVAEGVGLHFLIAHWSPMTAWVFTGLSAYAMLQLYAHMRAIKARPINVKDGMLYLRNGLAADACVRVDDIEEITLTRGRSLAGSSAGTASSGASGTEEKPLLLVLFGVLEGHSVRVKVRRPVTVVRMFGIRRRASVLLFAVDTPEELLKAIQGQGASPR